jgi:nucleoside-diphosphate-sugar epimerase
MQPRILITGANGFTGNYFVRYLQERGVPVRAMYYGPDGDPGFTGDGVESVAGDLRDRESLKRALEGIEVVQNIAALYRPTNVPNSLFFDVNVTGIGNIVELAKEAGVRRFVQCSTIGVHGTVGRTPINEDGPIQPDDHYQETKWLGEELAVKRAAELDLPLSVVRPAGIYGPLEHRFRKITQLVGRRRFLMFGSGETYYHFVHVRDLCDGLLLAGEKEEAIGRRYIIADDHAISIAHFVELLAKGAGVKPPRLRIPYWMLKTAALACEGVCKPFGISPPMHRRRAAWFVSNRTFDITRARRELGYVPRISIEDGVAEMVESFRCAGWL